MNRSDTLIVIPAFNEAQRIGAVITGVRQVLPAADLLVVDDGSRDDTAAVATSAGARCVRHVFNLGYGAALQTGYKAARHDGYRFVVQLDADGQHLPADIPRLLAPVAAGDADVVIGSRFVEARGYPMDPLRSVGRRLLQAVLRLCSGPHVTDPTSGFQALSQRAFHFHCGDYFPSDFPDIDVLLLLHRQGLLIREVAVDMAPNPPGHPSMHSGLKDVYYTYKMLLATFRSRFTPLTPATPADPPCPR